MTDVEFRGWLRQHCGYFPGIPDWLKSLANRQDILAAWRAVLRTVSLEAAVAATQRLYESEENVGSYERHAAAVRRIARSAAARGERERRTREVLRERPREAVSGEEIARAFGEAAQRLSRAATERCRRERAN